MSIIKYTPEQEDLQIECLKNGTDVPPELAAIDISSANSLYKRAFGSLPKINQISLGDYAGYSVERILDAIATGVPCNDTQFDSGWLL